jgi:uncharacterized protein YprB with RNaseH-like and TPR domain
MALGGEGFCSEAFKDVSPMKLASFFEGLNFLRDSLVAFDIETFSPRGFPYGMGDPVVNFSLAIPFFGNLRKGLFVVSFICDPRLESNLLSMLHGLLSGLQGCCLLTYNGLRFDVEYVVKRGGVWGFDFDRVFAGLGHVDLFRLVKDSGFSLSGYSQRAVERFVGVSRVVGDVSGASYHLAFGDFLRRGDLKALFYNIEDSVGCLQIGNRLFSVLNRGF